MELYIFEDLEVLQCRSIEDVKEVCSNSEKLLKRLLGVFEFLYESGYKRAYLRKNFATDLKRRKSLNGAVSFEDDADISALADGRLEIAEKRFKIEFVLASLSDDPNQLSYLDCLKMDSEGKDIGLVEFYLVEIFT